MTILPDSSINRSSGRLLYAETLPLEEMDKATCFFIIYIVKTCINRISIFLILMVHFSVNTYGQAYKEQVQTAYEEILNLRDARNYDAALRKADSILPIAKNLQDDAALGNIYVQIGRCYKEKNQFQSALTAYMEALRYREKIKDSIGMGKVYNNLSSLFTDEKLYEKAKWYSYKALNIYLGKKGPDTGPVSNAYINLANVLEETGSIDSAIWSGLEALKYIRTSSKVDSNVWQTAVYGLGKRYLKKGETDKAEAMLLQALQYNMDAKDTSKMAMCCNALGATEWKKNDMSKSLKYFQQAEEFAKTTENTLEMVTAQYNIGIIQSGKNNFEAADQAYKNALQALGDQKLPNETLDEVLRRNIEINKTAQSTYWIHTLLTATLFAALLLIVGILWKLLSTSLKNIELEKTANHEKEGRLLAQEEAIKVKGELVDIKHRAIKGTFKTILTYLEADEVIERNTFKTIVKRAIIEVDATMSPSDMTLAAFIKEAHIHAQFHAKQPVAFTYDIDDVSDCILRKEVQKNLLDIIALAYANIRIHAECENCTLAFETNGNMLIMIISDDGKGFKSDQITAESKGVKDIERKAKEINARMPIFITERGEETTSGEGTKIVISVPDPFNFDEPF